MNKSLILLGLTISSVMSASSFAERRYREIHTKLNRQYGEINGGIRLQQTAPTEGDPAVVAKYGDNAAINANGELVVNGIVIDMYDIKNLPLGMVSALQYDNTTWGKCFLGMKDTVDFVDIFANDWEALITEGDFYQLFFYDPVRFTSNYLAVYELCNMGTILDLASQILNLDPAVIMEFVTRQITAGFTVGPQIFADITTITTAVDEDGHMNYYDFGLALGRVMKVFFDFTINN